MYIDSFDKAWRAFIAAISLVTTGPDQFQPLLLKAATGVKPGPLHLVGLLARIAIEAKREAKRCGFDHATLVEFRFRDPSRWELVWTYGWNDAQVRLTGILGERSQEDEFTLEQLEPVTLGRRLVHDEGASPYLRAARKIVDGS